MENKIIELRDVWKTYKMGHVQVHALRGISLTINKSEFVAITGPSGSGKSTMMHIVGCLDIPTKGEVYLDEKNIVLLKQSKLSEIRGKKIGFMFQQFNLIPNLTALENVMLPMDFQDVPTDKIKVRAEKLLNLVGLGDRMNHRPSELSGGQQQRVSIARALSNDPEVILADEPTGNLDSKTGKEVMNFYANCMKKEEKTIIIVTHDENIVRYAKRVIKIKDGKSKGGKNEK